jgi:PAP2 superfamily
MMLGTDQSANRSRRARLRPAPEALEARQVLSAASMTLALDPTANAIIAGMVTAPDVVIDGQAMPGAKVQMKVGSRTVTGYADPSGQYQLKMPLKSGVYQIKVKAEDAKGQVATASMSATMGDAVLAWESTLIDVVKADSANVGLASRTLAMVSGAIYDAVNDIERTGSVYKINVTAPSGASASAAAAEAAYTVLSSLDPSMQSLLDVVMAQSIAAVPSTVALEGGMQVGLEVGQGILAWRANDGSSIDVPYVPGTAPGDWRPTPPTYQDAWGPDWGDVATFGVTQPISAYQPPPPPALNSPEYAADLNQVESLGALNSKTRTPYETQTGIFWAYDSTNTGTPVLHFQQIAYEVALQQHNTMTQNARMFGLVDVAMGDAGIAAWDSKYTYNRWRPITAIQLANTDGNPATTADPTWQPLGSPGAPGQPNFTPPFPSYVSGHASFGAALFTTLTDFYGTNNVHFTITSDQLPGVTRTFSSFSAASYQNAISRIYLGLHFWFDETAGLTMGNEIAKDIYGNVMTVNPA